MTTKNSNSMNARSAVAAAAATTTARTATKNKHHEHHEYHQRQQHPLNIRKSDINLLGWPTDVISIEYDDDDDKDADDLRKNNEKEDQKTHHRPHDEEQPEEPETIIIHVPGNPGQYDWYVPDMIQLLHKLGGGGPKNTNTKTKKKKFSFRGISHAGHGLFNNNNNTSNNSKSNNGITNVAEYTKQRPSADSDIPWTVDGQILHKCAFIDHLLRCHKNKTSMNQKRPSDPPPPPNFIFMGHSFGCYVIQQMLVLRPDILKLTKGCIYLMPFVRMNANTTFNQWKLKTVSKYPRTLIRVGTTFSQLLNRCLSPQSLERILKLSPVGRIDSPEARSITVQLMTRPTFVTNFFELGTKEIRYLPSDIDVDAYQTITDRCPIHMIYTANDQWAPKFHMDELQQLQSQNILPSATTTDKLAMTYTPNLKHDYVTDPRMSKVVVDWCFESIQKIYCVEKGATQQQNHQEEPSQHRTTRQFDGRHSFPKLRSKL